MGRPVKRRRALLRSNPQRNSRPETNGGTTGAGGPCSSAFVLMACATAIDDVVPLKISACLEKPPFCPVRTRWGFGCLCCAPRESGMAGHLKARGRRQFVILGWAVKNAGGKDRIPFDPIPENPFTPETP